MPGIGINTVKQKLSSISITLELFIVAATGVFFMRIRTLPPLLKLYVPYFM